MTVNGVNNSNNNAGAYAAGAAVVGGAAGATYGYLSKPFLKDGAPTDTFIRNIQKNMAEATPETKALYEESMKAIADIENAKNADELKNVLKNNSIIKEQGEDFIEILIRDIDEKGFEAAKADAKKGIQLGLDWSNNVAKETFNMCWDKETKKFVHNADEITEEGFKAVKSAARKIQLKTAGIYGGIAAAVLGLGTYLCCAGKKAPEAEQKVDA